MYQRHGWKFRYIHDLKELLAGLQEKGLSVPENLEEATGLTSYAHEFRYPGVEEPVTEQECKQAVTFAENMLRWAESQLAEETL